MTINAASWIGTTAPEHTSARDTRADYDHADDFAGMFAGAVQSTASKPEPKKPEGTSELDRPEERVDDSADDKKVKRSRGRSSTHAKDAADSTSEVVQSTAALDPELQAKLARVMARMRDETGHDVTVSETYRSQDRQNALFAQGRTTSGPVVTWTQNSKHTQGRAVDVILDGGAAELDAYTTLQRIAGEEGLRTLGARDPGHLELPGLSTTLPTDATPLPEAPADATGPGQVSIARLAQVAQIAQVAVAKPTEVARVAAVARPEIPVGAIARGQNAAPSQNANGLRADQRVQATHGDVGSVAQKPGDDSTDAGSTDGNSSNNGKGERGYGSLAAAVALRDMPTHSASPIHSAVAGTPVSAAERAAQIIAAYQDAPARPISQLTMSVDAGNGITDKVQIALRGTSLNAAIDAGDTRGAQAMNARADELVRALSKDGIEVESLRVRAAATTTTVASATGASHSSQTSSDASNQHSRFERNNPWQQQDRQRSQDDRRQQQRNQRGGRDQ